MPDTSASSTVAQAHDMGAEILADLQRMVEQGVPAAPAIVQEGTDIAERKQLAQQTINLYREIIERYEAQAASVAAAPVQVAESAPAISIDQSVADVKAKYGY